MFHLFQVVETAIKLEKRKQLSEEKMSLEADGVETVTENVFKDLDDAQGVSIKLNEKSPAKSGAKTSEQKGGSAKKGKNTDLIALVIGSDLQCCMYIAHGGLWWYGVA